MQTQGVMVGDMWILAHLPNSTIELTVQEMNKQFKEFLFIR